MALARRAKRPLSLEEHEEFGRELERVHRLLNEQHERLQTTYGKTNAAVKALYRCRTTLTTLRFAMTDVLDSQFPADPRSPYFPAPGER